MIALNINVLKIPKDRIVVGKKGEYLDLVLFDNKHGRDEFGNDGFVSISMSKQERQNGEKGVIIGNWKHINTEGAKPKQEKETKESEGGSSEEEDSEIPF